MKGKLLSFTGLILAGMFTNQLHAQNYQPLAVQSGFNADVIANGVGPSASSTNNDVDGASYAFVSRDFKLTASSTALTYGLPVNGIINSAVASTSGLTYQLGSYSANNSLRLQNAGDTGTLQFSNPLSATVVYMLATGGSGPCTVDATVNFTDNTSQTFTGVAISDWYGGSNYAIQGIGRIKKTNDNLESGSGTDPRLYQLPLAIDAANQSKTVKSVTVAKTGTGGIPNIFGFAVNVYNSCAMPTSVTATTTMNGASVSWTAPASAPSAGYQYYLSTSSTAPTATTTPTASVASGTSVTLNSLTTGQTYYFWVRSNCGGSSQSYWTMTQFTPGQLTATYTTGDISSDYASSEPSATTSIACSGTVSVSIPAGYKIASTKVKYQMTSTNLAYMEEQRSILVCTTNNTPESSTSSGTGSQQGTYTYERSGLNIANNLTGTVNFQLRAWRMWGNESAGCDASYTKVDNGTYTVTVTLQPASALATNEVSTKGSERIAYPNPFADTLYLEKAENVKKAVLTDPSGVVVTTVENPSSALFLGGIKSGMYILTLTMKDGSVKSMKTIKK
ncbi:hypothetical protein QE422_003980 [Chryseobacterium sp. SORGH_AS 447]|uniref:T9SS type A sorting domain-containing protein n=1 Tax=Chryseobacterium sp. SORGH_AS_0447 TaxID=3041769 RepID=UPI002780CF46|nr:T9SS type A sorting domain-containing protein [Chryseobacterium sp. SORGH_AS_0447]MDQ1163612.1 hypothetical protein [Chryseobacterium sp. SORGH_AS_0447]